MSDQMARRKPRPAQIVAERALTTLEHFIHLEKMSGIVLLVAAAVALIWANSPARESYEALWHLPVSIGIGELIFARDLHFWINDVLMTVFFLVVGLEIRREIHEGALSDLRQAALPVAAALGGVVAPALIYLAFNIDPLLRHGWAVPTATDIAFAIGVLALLGKAIPSNVRILLLALAIIDDIVAVLIIALFYSSGLDYTGLLIAFAGILAIVALQAIGIGNASTYVLPGVVLWVGLYKLGIHPSLAGVVLGLMTPVLPLASEREPLDLALRAVEDLKEKVPDPAAGPDQMAKPLKELRFAQREMLPPVSRVQMALHPWVAFIIMPLFALANAGVSIDGINLEVGGSRTVMLGVLVGLVVGKPLGVLLVSWLVVRFGWCRLPPGVTWSGILVVGLLAGIGFTMAIFVANLAFTDANLLGAGKLGVLLGSLISSILGLLWGKVYARRLQT